MGVGHLKDCKFWRKYQLKDKPQRWLSECIRQRRDMLKMTQEELAKRAGLTREYVTNIETLYRMPSLKAIKKIEKVIEAPYLNKYWALHRLGKEYSAKDNGLIRSIVKSIGVYK